jgi:general secretion pathway protein G
MARGVLRRQARIASGGFTVVELAIVLTVVGLLAGLASTQYFQFVEKARIAKATIEIASLGEVIEATQVFSWGGQKSALPDSLTELGLTVPTDPWGTPYRYFRIEGVWDVTQQTPGEGSLPHVAAGPRPQPDQPRKDRFFKPINTDFDLYSSGPNGDSRDSLEHDDSRDDVVRGLNGRFVGLAENF